MLHSSKVTSVLFLRFKKYTATTQKAKTINLSIFFIFSMCCSVLNRKELIMLRLLMFSILLLSCSPKVYQEPIVTHHDKVAILDQDPLCRVKRGKRSEELLEDILRYNRWGYLSGVEVPYKLTKKSLTAKRCGY